MEKALIFASRELAGKFKDAFEEAKVSRVGREVQWPRGVLIAVHLAHSELLGVVFQLGGAAALFVAARRCSLPFKSRSLGAWCRFPAWRSWLASRGAPLLLGCILGALVSNTGAGH